MHAADELYEQEGLIEREEKKQRDCTEGKVWGAMLGGASNNVGAGLDKLLTLSLVTLAIMVEGSMSQAVFDSLMGNWGFPLQFRRPLMALLQHSFVWGSRIGRFAKNIPKHILDELLMLIILFNQCSTCLTSAVCTNVAATDASPGGLGCCEARVPHTLAHRRKRYGKILFLHGYT